MEKTLENEFHCQIAEIFGRLFMTHKERTLPIAAQLDAKFICTSLQDSQPPRLQKFGLFLIDDIIDNLGDIEEVRKIYFEVKKIPRLTPLEILQPADQVLYPPCHLRQTRSLLRTRSYGQMRKGRLLPSIRSHTPKAQGGN